jgi:hypothetical protein
MLASFIEFHQRNRRSWRQIVARMSPQSRLEWNLVSSAQAEVIGASWSRSPRAAFRDSGVLPEMADYAERHALSCDPARMRAVRAAALELRTAATRAMIRQIFTR